MPETFGTIRKSVELNAIVHAPCTCGTPWAEHKVIGCLGYTPSKPSVNHGTIFFQSQDWLANLLFKFERFFQRLRVARLRSL